MQTCTGSKGHRKSQRFRGLCELSCKRSQDAPGTNGVRWLVSTDARTRYSCLLALVWPPNFCTKCFDPGPHPFNSTTPAVSCCSHRGGGATPDAPWPRKKRRRITFDECWTRASWSVQALAAGARPGHSRVDSETPEMNEGDSGFRRCATGIMCLFCYFFVAHTLLGTGVVRPFFVFKMPTCTPPHVRVFDGSNLYWSPCCWPLNGFM